MPNLLGNNLHLCFSAIKRPQITQHPTPANHSRPSSAAAAATAATFFKNYNSLYDFSAAAPPDNPPPPTSYSDDLSPSSSSSHADDHIDDAEATPDFAALHASNRFFFSSPGRSNSIIDSSSSSSSLLDSLPQESDPSHVAAGGVAVQTYSPDPYSDFRRSMQEMVEARDKSFGDSRSNWDYLHELLLCYLSLNPKSTHGFIIKAFADVLVNLVSADGGDGVGRDL
ncbi:hypothetical protein Dimus_016905 [Dionaea muscipula]